MVLSQAGVSTSRAALGTGKTSLNCAYPGITIVHRLHRMSFHHSLDTISLSTVQIRHFISRLFNLSLTRYMM
jgi:hypothetical protein